MLPKHCVICLALIAQSFIAVNCDTGLAEEAFVKNMREILDSPQLTDPAHPFHAEISTILHSQKSNLFEEGLKAALLKSNVSLSPQCEADLAMLLEQFYQMWALKFLDAWGKPTPGILLGSLKWTGSYQQCMELTSPVFNQTVGNKTESRSFIGQYCTVVIGSNKGGGGEVPGAGAAADVQLGVCLPDSCSERDIYIIFETVWYKVTKSIATVYSSCQPTKRDTTKLSSAAIGMICVLSILGFLMVLGTAYDIIFYQPSIYRTTQKLQEVNEADEEKTDPVENGMDDDTHLRVEDYTPIVQDHQNEEIKLKVNKTLAHSNTGQFLLCFSILSNGGKILNSDHKSSYELGCIHGIRFFSMTWVILGHAILLQIAYFKPGFASGFLLCFSITRSGAKILNTTNVSESNLGAIHGIRFFSMTWVILGHATVFPAQLYSIGFQFLLCFSININGEKVLSVPTMAKQSTSTLQAIHGIRFISMTWVMLGHTVVFAMSYFSDFLLCFSIITNGRKILEVPSSPNQASLQAVHGIRFLSMSWVILGHTYFFALTIQLLSIGYGFLLCFSIHTNGAKLLQVPTRASQATLQAIHGVRFLSMAWVILGHTFYFLMRVQSIRNLAILPDIIKRFSMQAILGATVSVDTFFLLSGVLTTFLCLREMKTRDGPRHINWALYYFHRFWRLTPPYMLVLGTFVALFPYMGSGPFWPTTDINAACSGSWWTNLLYINNLVRTGPQEQCFGWAWFLANDMQFYIISPLMLVPFYFSGIAGTVVTLVLMLASFITTGVISSSNHYLPGMLGAVSPLAQAPDFVNHTQTNSFNDLYIPPYTRIGPYLVGVLLGYLLYKTDRKVKMHWIVALVGWLIAAVLGMICVYGLWGVVKGTATMSNSVSALYNTVHRSVWGVAVAWVIFACVTGHGGFVNTLLSWQALVPLSRLTYMAYLVHPIVIFANLLQHQDSLSYTDFNIIYLFLGNLTLSYMVAFVVSLAFESPMMALEKLVFKRNK